MTEETDEPDEGEPDETEPAGDPDADEGRRMEDVDHTHPDTGESFTETGVYDRGGEQSDQEGS